jgi:hypothetical protein
MIAIVKRRTELRPLLAALGLAAAGAGAAPVAPVELPPLGLYRIDSDATIGYHATPAETRITTDGASGDTRARYTVGERSATRQFKGTAPVTHCVKAVTGGVFPVPNANTCSVKAFTRTKDGFTQTAQCAFGTLHLTVHRLDKDRWEFLHDVQMTSTGAAPNLSAIKPLLEQQAAHGETPEQRARAKQQLADLPTQQKQGDATYAAMIAKMNESLRTSTDPEERAAIRGALARLQPGTPTMKTRARMVWTRIGDSCGLGQ